MEHETGIIILAAGQGKRMGGPLPKVLSPLAGRPMIEYVLSAVAESHLCGKPLVVVGVGADEVKKVIGERADYVLQQEQRGTGHAVHICRGALESKFKNIIVLYGDMPFVTASTIRILAETHQTSGARLTMVTVELPDFNEWRAHLYHYGRIVRDRAGNIQSIVEFKDCTDKLKEIREVNPSFFCFDAVWLWNHIGQIGKDNAQGEYYLTDLVSIAVQAGEKIASISADPKVAVGVNTTEHLTTASLLI